MHRRLLLVAAMVVALAMVTAPVALAGKPTTSPFDYTVDFSMPCVCTFDLSVTAHAWGTDYYFPQKNGNLVDIGTATERDTFSANGHTLVGSPYWYAYREAYDATGTASPASWWDSWSASPCRTGPCSGARATSTSRMARRSRPPRGTPATSLPSAPHSADRPLGPSTAEIDGEATDHLA